ncbi:DUF2975 domain-containing protein [Nocardioides abyssi]|uniref:DUF2975 domain-containing protein n=1 Tax=Nocardioides abyssi TaxID=3058370 RepID=A0ABT8ET72_9ACTN|nr:DUF2975 domain-containing protein [Nocardioides abyssi]MDN4161121.1 DUF2975 domain-containing protein [Nocardioides abyssi]
MPSPQRRSDPFGPIETAVSLLLSLFVLAMVAFGALGVIGYLHDGSTGVSVATIGDPEACALVSNESVPSATDVPQRGIRRGVGSVIAERVEICIAEPTAFQKAASALAPVGDMVLGVGALFLLRRAIRTGRRSGPFTMDFARRVRQLGWFLLVMAAVWPFVAAAGRGVVLEAVVPRRTWTYALWEPGISVTLIVVALGVLTTARLLQRAVALQQEADDTV